MKSQILTFIFCFFGSISPFFAQRNNTSTLIKGQVIDSTSMESIPYATIRIFSDKDLAKPIKAIATDDDGKFELPLGQQAGYALVINYTGKSTLSKMITVGSEKNINLGKLLLTENENTLNEVVVSAIRPLIKADLDKISYSMEDDPESTTNNVLEMIKKVPMLSVDSEDNIQLKGSSNYKIYLDGKPSDMITSNPKEILKSMPASSIKSIEVITEPGAKYEAEGVAGIINIITKRDTKLKGYNGSLYVGGNTKGDSYYGGYGTFKSGKLGVTGNINRYHYNTPYDREESTTESFNRNSTQKYEYRNNSSKYYGNGYYGKVEISYEIDTLNLIYVHSSVYSGNNKSKENGDIRKLDFNDAPFSHYEKHYESLRKNGNQNYGIDYQRTFGVKDRLLTSSYKLHIEPNKGETQNDIYDLMNDATHKNRQLTTGDTKEHNFQIDFTTPFKEKHSIETGAKYSLRLSNSDNSYETMNANGGWDLANDNNRQFKYTQSIISSYAAYGFKLKKFGFKTGLRYEATILDAKYPLNTANNYDVDYHNFVPSTSITYQLHESQNIRFGYNMRISRPGIWQLSPFENKSDENSYYKGNPNLKPTKSHNISSNYSIYKPKFNFNLNLSYTFANDAIEYFTVFDNGKKLSTYENVGKNQHTYLSLYGNWSPNQLLRIYSSANLGYSDYKSKSEYNRNNSGILAGISGGVQYKLPWKLRFNGDVGFRGKEVNYKGYASGFVWHGLSVTKSLLSDKLDITVRAIRPFDKTVVRKFEESMPDYHMSSRTVRTRQHIGINISYRFGETKAQITKVKRGLDADDESAGSNQRQNGGE